MWLIDVLLIVFGKQRRSTAKKNKIFQALDTHTILTNRSCNVAGPTEGANLIEFLRAALH